MRFSHPCPHVLAVGTVVSFFFPPRGPDAGPPKARPCLVIAADTETPGSVSIAYGTSAATDANQGLDLALGAWGEIKAAGLHRPTRFVLARRVVVSATDRRFARNARGTAVLGELPAQTLRLLATLTASLGPAIWQDACPPPARLLRTPGRPQIAIAARQGPLAETRQRTRPILSLQGRSAPLK